MGVNKFHITMLTAMGLVIVLFFYLTPNALAVPHDGLPPYYIDDIITGGECGYIGNWNSVSKTCTLSTDIYVSSTSAIQISIDGATLEGNNHSIVGDYSNNVGVSAGSSDVTVKNLSVSRFGNIGVWAPGYNATVTGIIATENGEGIACSSGCQAYNNTASSNTAGFYLHGATGAQVYNNNLVGNSGYGLHLLSGSSNTISNNEISNNGLDGIYVRQSDLNDINHNIINGNSGWTGIKLSYSSDNTIAMNTISNNYYGINYDPPQQNSFHNLIYGNFFDSNTIQAWDNPGNQSVYALAAPIGGNTWSDFDTPSEGCHDLNADGFCDSPYIFSGGQDDLPLTSQPGCGRPDLNLSMNDVYWGSLSDYDNRELTIEYDVVSFFDVSAIDIEGISCSADVSTLSLMPMTMTHTAPGQWDATVKLSIPEGVTVFTTSVYGSTQDTCGNVYEYPGPYPGP